MDSDEVSRRRRQIQRAEGQVGIDWHRIWTEHGCEYNDFLNRFGSEGDRLKWERVRTQLVWTDPQESLVRGFRRKMPILVMAGAWCGDCARQCPLIYEICRRNSLCQLRFVERDQVPEVAAELTICGSPRIPQTVMFDEDFNFVSRWGERTLSQLRQLGSKLSGASCATGIASSSDQAETLQEWLNSFEYSQWVLRLSPRLRERHGD